MSNAIKNDQKIQWKIMLQFSYARDKVSIITNNYYNYVKIYSHVDSNIQNKTRTFQGSYA